MNMSERLPSGPIAAVPFTVVLNRYAEGVSERLGELSLEDNREFVLGVAVFGDDNDVLAVWSFDRTFVTMADLAEADAPTEIPAAFMSLTKAEEIAVTVELPPDLSGEVFPAILWLQPHEGADEEMMLYLLYDEAAIRDVNDGDDNGEDGDDNGEDGDGGSYVRCKRR